MKIAIIGAGFTGLTAAYKLSQKGHRVTIFEKESLAGGLGAGFKQKDWEWSLESFFHHLFISDQAVKDLIDELHLKDKLFLTPVKTSIFYQKQISRLDSAFSLLTFPALSLLEKFRAGAITFYLRSINNWRKFEKLTAAYWLQKYYGKKIYQILWQPLLKAKFNDRAEEISMSWFWGRIKKRSAKLGYLESGFQSLADKLSEKIKSHQGKILLNHEIKNLEQLKKKGFDRIIFTTPASVFLEIVPELPKEYKNKLQKLEMFGTLNLILVLKEKFFSDNTYWLNINEPGFPFVAVVEHTNFINPSHYAGNHLLYIGGYYPLNHRYFKMKKEQILKEFLPYLEKINPKFNSLSLVTYYLTLNSCAQPIVPINYSRLIPTHKTPLPHIFLANMQQIYPWDRGINYSVELGEKIADEIQNS